MQTTGSLFFFPSLGMCPSDPFPECGKVSWFQLASPGNTIKLYQVVCFHFVGSFICGFVVEGCPCRSQENPVLHLKVNAFYNDILFDLG